MIILMIIMMMIRYDLLSNTCTAWRDVGKDYIQYDKLTQKPFIM